MNFKDDTKDIKHSVNIPPKKSGGINTQIKIHNFFHKKLFL